MTVRFAVGDFAFEWDERKAVANRRKHGVTFEEAATAFLDPDARIFDDPDHSAEEPRFLLVGESAGRRVLLVVHVERGDALRLVSARVAAPGERATMGKGDA
jgi:uncharacterized DUF497 family protein